MPQTLPLLRGKEITEITYSAAREEEVNIIHQLGYHAKQSRFFSHLRDRQDWLKSIVSHHLGLPSAACHVAREEDWLNGSYNVCIPVTIRCWNNKRVLIRFPLPYRIGEAFRPGNGDEKIRCEAGAYTWLQENCPDIPIPRLYGFALSTGETVRDASNVHFFRLTEASLLDLSTYQPSLVVFRLSADVSCLG